MTLLGEIQKSKRKSSVRPSPYYEKMLDTFDKVGHMSISEMAHYLGVQNQMIAHHIRVLRERGVALRIVRWRLKEIKGRREPVYGYRANPLAKDIPRQDVKEPPPISRKEQKDRYYKKYRIKISLKNHGAKSKIARVNNPFGLTLAHLPSESSTGSNQ